MAINLHKLSKEDDEEEAEESQGKEVFDERDASSILSMTTTCETGESMRFFKD